MQLEILYIEENDIEALEKCNSFLRSHKVISVQERFIEGNPSKWSVFIRYVGKSDVKNVSSDRKDYKEILSELHFSIFAKMREVRKVMAEELLLPAYVIFTNEELAQLAQLDVLDLQSLQKVNGVGAKKADKFGLRFLELMKSIQN